MKKTILVLFGVFVMIFSEGLEAQNIVDSIYKVDISNFDEYGKAAFGEDNFVALDQSGRKFYKDIFVNRLTIAKLDEKPSDYNSLENAPVYNEELVQKKNFDPKKFNPFNYKINYFDKVNTVYYEVYDTGYYIIIEKWQPNHNL